MGVSNFTGPRESKLTIPRARKMAKPSKIPRIVNEIPGNLRANSQEKAVKLERNIFLHKIPTTYIVFPSKYPFSRPFKKPKPKKYIFFPI